VEAHQEIVRRFPLSAIRIPQSGINSSVYFRSRYWIADAHRNHGRRFVVRADELLTAFLELELVTRG
jgi:hypothetical protein